jgi:hypothetical protein
MPNFKVNCIFILDILLRICCKFVPIFIGQLPIATEANSIFSTKMSNRRMELGNRWLNRHFDPKVFLTESDQLTAELTRFKDRSEIFEEKCTATPPPLRNVVFHFSVSLSVFQSILALLFPS